MTNIDRMNTDKILKEMYDKHLQNEKKLNKNIFKNQAFIALTNKKSIIHDFSKIEAFNLKNIYNYSEPFSNFHFFINKNLSFKKKSDGKIR